MRKTLMVAIGLVVALLMALGAWLGIGSSQHRPMASSFACAVVMNTYGVCVGPPTNDA